MKKGLIHIEHYQRLHTGHKQIKWQHTIARFTLSTRKIVASPITAIKLNLAFYLKSAIISIRQAAQLKHIP